MGICGFIGKIMGALYRIPLTNIIGSEGMGLYQMVFPLYSLLLTVSSTGMPTAIAKLVSEKIASGNSRQAKRTFYSALVSLTAVGMLAAAALFFCAGLLARAQGNEAAALSYKAIAPAIVFVAAISAFRGYFQGRMNMTPAAISQITEQTVKLAAGLTFAWLLSGRGIAYAAFGALIGVSLSELATLAQLLFSYLFFSRKYPLKPEGLAAGKRASLKELYILCLPVTLGGLIMPLSQFVDSALIINLLIGAGQDTGGATALYGLLTGPVGSLINMPTVLSLSIACAVLPSLSESVVCGNRSRMDYKINRAVKFCFIISLGGALGLLVLAESVVSLLYGGGLTEAELRLAASLLRLTSVSVIYIGLSQVFTYILQAAGKMYLPVVGLLLGASVKTVLILILIRPYGIAGCAVASVAGYAVSALSAVIFLKVKVGAEMGLIDNFLKPCIAGGAMFAVAYLCIRFLSPVLGHIAALILAALLGTAAFAVILTRSGALSREEIESLPLGKKTARILARFKLLAKNKSSD